MLTATLPRGTDIFRKTHRSYGRAVTTVGIRSPGAMGSAVGATYLAGGSRVVTTLAGRSPRSAGLARAAGLEELPALNAVVAASDLLLSIVPPGRARAAAEAIAAAARRTTRAATRWRRRRCSPPTRWG